MSYSKQLKAMSNQELRSEYERLEEMWCYEQPVPTREVMPLAREAINRLLDKPLANKQSPTEEE